MRMLTFPEARQVEQLKARIATIRNAEHFARETIVISPNEADFWLNILDMALQTNEALSLAWKRSPNPQTDIVALVRSAFD